MEKSIKFMIELKRRKFICNYHGKCVTPRTNKEQLDKWKNKEGASINSEISLLITKTIFATITLTPRRPGGTWITFLLMCKKFTNSLKKTKTNYRPSLLFWTNSKHLSEQNWALGQKFTTKKVFPYLLMYRNVWAYRLKNWFENWIK